MRRGIFALLSLSALVGLTPAAFGQYPYPYGPMPYGPMPYAPMPYGMPAARPVYYAPPMPQPMPMWQGPAPANKTVFVYGPLTDTPIPTSPPLPVNPAAPAPPAPAVAPTSTAPVPAIPVRGGARSLATFSKADLALEGCGPDGCGPDGCGPTCGPMPYEPPMRGKGHFIGEVGAYFLAPVGVDRPAFAVNGQAINFDSQILVGPRASFGYMFHSGCGVRANYDYLNGSQSQSAANGNTNLTITSPAVGPFTLASPGPALQNGIGADQLSFSQRLERNVADIEFLSEGHIFDTTFLFTIGGRYGRMNQGYTATRTNGGGTNGVVTFASDAEELASTNFFEGWGPTVSLEFVHPIKCGFSIYGNMRGSFLWGTGKFTQTDHVANRSTDAFGVPTFVDVTRTNEDVSSNREVSILEMETGLQFGHRCGRCYLFARSGFVYQRWFDVGTPTTTLGSVTFIGGTIRAGITY